MAFRPPDPSTPEASSVKHPEFETSNNHNYSEDERGVSASQCWVEVGFKAGVSMHEERVCNTIVNLQKPESKKQKSRRSDCAQKRRNNERGCNCAARVAGDCAAVCCCPCVIVHVLILALVKLPFAVAKKAFIRAKKMASVNKNSDTKKKTDENGEDDDKLENCRVYSPPWSYRESLRMTEPVEGLASPRFDSHKLWSELYASGHMGFGGVPCERD